MKKIDKKFKWNDLPVAKIEKKHDIKLVAKREGLGDEPCSKSTGSILEGEIQREADKNLQSNTENLRKYLEEVEKEQNKLSSFLKQNHFQPTVNNLDASLNAYENKKELEMAQSHNSWKIYKEEQDQFKKYHQISREPNFATMWNSFKHLGLILVLFLVEAILNGAMLQGALVGGPVEGVGTAIAIAFLNCIASGLAGYYIFKKINHLEKKTKILWGFFALVYTTFIIYLNFCLGAYRSKSEEVFQKIYGDGLENQNLSVEQSLETLSQAITPWSSEIEFMFVGLILTFVGIFFASLSIIGGLTYNDTYPAYGNVGRNVNNYKKALEKINKLYVKDITKLEDSANTKLHSSYNKIKKDELNFWDHNTNIIQKEFVNYEQKVDYTVRGARHIIGEYRKENSKVRKSNAPLFFNEKWDVPENVRDPKKKFRDIAFHYMSDEEREERKLKLSDDIDQKFIKAEDQIKVLQKQAIDKQKELHEKYSTY